MMPYYLSLIAQGILFILTAPLVIGILRWSRARLQRRQGPSPKQPYRDLYKLMNKQSTLPDNASGVFLTAPLIIFVCYAILGFMVPVVFLHHAEAVPWGDLLIIIYIIGLARLTLGLAGMDSGAPFGGLGSSREMFLQVLVEPTFLFIAFALALKWQTTSITAIITSGQKVGLWGIYTDPGLLLLLLAWFIVLLIETGRLPFDNPGTHLELTMFSKAIRLEYSGPHLALLEWAEALRLTFFLTLLANIFLPSLVAAGDQSMLTNTILVLLYPLKLSVLVIFLTLWEINQVKQRLRAIVTPAVTALVFSILSAILIIAEKFFIVGAS
jgi:formate hydrogenlyase subunit 4